MPCSTPFNGSPNAAAQFLIERRPQGWKEELAKLKDMSGARFDPTKLKQKDWPIRFRHISPRVVLPQQVIKLSNTITI